MTKRTKRLLFYSAVLVFLIASYIIVLYAQGYKYSFSEGKFLRTGAIYLKVNTDAQVFLNNKLVDSTSFFGNSVTINRLLPGQYPVKVERTDYYIWQKNVTVEEGLVTEFLKVVLLPNKGEEKDLLIAELTELLGPKPKVKPTPAPSKRPSPSPTPTPTPSPEIQPFYLKNKILYKTTDDPKNPQKIAVNISGFALSEKEDRILWWDSANQLWVMWLFDTGYQPLRKAGDKELIYRFPTLIKNAAWFRDSDHVAVDSNGYKVLEIDKRGGLNVYSVK